MCKAGDSNHHVGSSAKMIRMPPVLVTGVQSASRPSCYNLKANACIKCRSFPAVKLFRFVIGATWFFFALLRTRRQRTHLYDCDKGRIRTCGPPFANTMFIARLALHGSRQAVLRPIPPPCHSRFLNDAPGNVGRCFPCTCITKHIADLL